jgi:hypothetical protein
LSPLVSRLGASVGLHSLQVQNRNIASYSSRRSRWVLLAREASEIDRLERMIRARMRYAGVSEPEVVVTRPEQADLEAAPLWTDDYSNILSVLKFAR